MNGTESLVRAYYDAFNAGDKKRFLSLLAEDVAHDINQGMREIGKPAFDAFFDRMAQCYAERITDLVVMQDHSGVHAAAEFVVHGTYKQAESGLPPARSQKYSLAAGAFFEIRDGKIARVSNYYNMSEWLAQVS